jgi:YidC/Oxa1 family membrane protein insertase
MEKRIFAAVLISIGFLWLWAAVAPKLFPDLMKKPVPAKVETTSTTATATTTPPPVTASTTTTAPEAIETPAPAPVVVTPIAATAQTISTITSPDYVAKFSNRGAELISFHLTHYKARPSDKYDPT